MQDLDALRVEIFRQPGMHLLLAVLRLFALRDPVIGVVGHQQPQGHLHSLQVAPRGQRLVERHAVVAPWPNSASKRSVVASRSPSMLRKNSAQ